MPREKAIQKIKNINKIISVIFILLFIIIFSFYNFEEYSQFHKNKIELKKIENQLKENIENFSLKDIEEIKDIQFYHTPNKDLLNKITEHILNAKKEVLLETYMLTEKRIQEALIKAHKKWVNIKVILEKDPYLAYNINNKAYEKLFKEWIDIKWSNKSNYWFNHSKILLIDNLSIISTGNFSYSTFTKNRDFFIFTTDAKIYEKLKINFYNDYNWIKINIYDNNLIFSPNNSRIKFEKLFLWAEKSIKMYFQYLKDDDLVNLLTKIKQEKNINITIIIPNTASDDENIIKLKKIWVNIQKLAKYKMHAKAILIDNKYLFIWSINFSTYSIDRNREVWILIKNSKIINNFLKLFNQDIKNNF